MSTIMKRFALLPVLALLAACQPAPQGEEPADAPAAEATAAPEPAQATDARAVSTTGVGPITASTPFDAETIRALFTGAEVEAEFLHGEGQPTPIITVTGDEETVLEIQGGGDGNVGQVMVLGGPFTGPGGETLMAGWPDLGLTAADCEMGEGRFTGQPVCSKADAPGLTFILAVPNWGRGELPDPTTLNGRARLAAIVWMRP
jgi:hypothetical protein